MSHTIPEPIVAAAQELAETLGAWCTAGQNESLAAHEQAVLARVGAATDFREAAELLAELTGLELGAETVRRHTERLGAALRASEDAAVAQVERTREAAEPVDTAPGVLLVETDGAMVRYLDG